MTECRVIAAQCGTLPHIIRVGFAKKGYTVLEAVFHFEKGEKEAILSKMTELNAQRREKQPLNYPAQALLLKDRKDTLRRSLLKIADLEVFQ